MVSRSSAAAHVRLNQACRRPTVYPHFFAHNLGYPLPCPKVNWKVRLNNGKIALLDMAYPDIKVAIEYDGRHHAGQWLADSKRREALEDDGWAYIQVTAENLMNDFEERALAQRVADRMSQRLSKPIMLCQRMSSGRIHIRITSLANGSRKILI